MPSILKADCRKVRHCRIVGVSNCRRHTRCGVCAECGNLWQTAAMTMTEPTFKFHHYLGLSIEHSGKSSGQIARELGVNRDTISRWINGRNKPSTPALMAFAQVTGVDFEWLCARRDSNPQPSDP